MALRRVVRGAGWAALAFGVLVLLFVAYQLWGTDISAKFHQDQLRAEFNHELALAQRHTSDPTPSHKPLTTTTTLPIDRIAEPQPGDVPAEGQPIGSIDIPKIAANFVVVQGVSTNDLQLGPGHYPGTPLPGQPGNAAIAGHRTTYLAPFSNLDQLQPGDPIYLTTTQGRFEYQVSKTLIVAPSDTAVLDPTPVPELTLTTCNPRYSAAQRLVVQALFVDPPAGPTIASVTSPASAPTSAVRGVLRSIPVPGTRGTVVWNSIFWGAACIALALTVWIFARRRSRTLARWAIGIFGGLGFLVLLFFFFGNISQLLPASF